MSNNNPNEYEYIKALVRGLHIPKNVARPDGALLSPHPTSRSSYPLNPNSDTPEQDTTSATDDEEEEEEEEDRLPSLDEANASGRRGSGMKITYNELSRLRKQHKQTLRHNRKGQQPSHHRSNHSLNIPSVIVTGANEQTDLLTSTQRRFSQLYSGLRRFSTSHTVCYMFRQRFVPLFLCGG